MREQFHLTNGQEILYPGVRRVIFMAENQEVPKSVETPKIEPTPKTPTFPQEGKVSPEAGLKTSEEARKEWEKHLGRPPTDMNEWLAEQGIGPEKLTEEEKETAAMLKKREIPVVHAGGAPTVTATEFDQELARLSGEIREPELKAFLTGRVPDDLEQFGRMIERLDGIYEQKNADYAHDYVSLSQAWETEQDPIAKTSLQRQLEGRTRAFSQFSREYSDARAVFIREYSKFRRYVDVTLEERQIHEDALQAKEKNETKDYQESMGKLIKLMVARAARGERTHFDYALRQEILKDPRLSELYLETIISEKDITPKEAFRLAFYLESDLEAFLHDIRALDEAQYLKLNTLRRVRIMFHEANRALISGGGDLESFLRITPELGPEELQAHTKIIGVDVAERLYERAFQRHLRRNGAISETDFENIHEWVKDVFNKLANNKIFYDISPEGKEIYRGLDNWERDRAVILARNFMSLSYRGPEYVAQGEIIEEPSSERWSSYPFEFPVRALQFQKAIGVKFDPGLGGPEFKEIFNKIREDLRAKSGLPKIERLKRVGGVDTDMLELTKILDASGLISSWRDQKAFLNSIRIKLGSEEQGLIKLGSEEQDLIKFLDKKDDPRFAKRFGLEEAENGQKTIPLGFYIDAIEAYRKHLRERRENKIYDEDHEIEAQLWKPIVKDVNFFLGDLARRAPKKLGTKVGLWKKVAATSPVRTAYLLDAVIGDDLRNRFSNLEEKLIELEEKRVIFESDEFESTDIGLEKVNDKIVKVGIPKIYLDGLIDESERKTYFEIVRLGYSNAEKLADIDFPFTPFMDDFLLRKADYMSLGSAVMPRRYASDLASFFKAGQAAVHLQDNLGAPAEERRKILKEMLNGIASPQGKARAQEVIYPFICASYKMFEKFKRAKIPGWGWVMKTTHQPTSLVQKFAGEHSPSYDESDISVNTSLDLREELISRQRKGDRKPLNLFQKIASVLPFLDKDKYLSNLELLRKNLGSRALNVLFDYIRSWGPLGIAFAAYYFGKELAAESRR